MRFYLGTHEPSWLATTSVPLFLSYRRLASRRGLPRALGPWALDSGGFSQLSIHGRWTFPPERYADDVRRFAATIGRLEWATTCDWMCEPEVRKKTGLSVRGHQERTTTSYLELRLLAPEIPWAPVLQGWTLGDYLDHLVLYERAGVDLRAAPVIGVGSICRRQQTMRAALLLNWIARETGLRLHGFGLKTQGLAFAADALASADSLAWSFNARRNRPLPECQHARCSSCLRYALEWREGLLSRLERRAA